VLIEANSQYLFCYITENSILSALCLTNLFKPVSHTFNLETYVPIFVSDYIIFAF